MARDKNSIVEWVIYKITNPNGRVYIGKSCEWIKRYRNYKSGKSIGRQPIVSRSIWKYGFDKHTVDVIDKFESNSEYASGKEIFWIRSYMSNFQKYPQQNGMNLTDGGEGSLGYKKSLEERQKMRNRNIGAKRSDEWKRKMSIIMTGRKMAPRQHHVSEETRQKLSMALKGIKYSDALKAKYKNAVAMRSRPVAQYDKSNRLINTFPSISDAERKLGISNIWLLLNKGVKKTRNHNFIFKYL